MPNNANNSFLPLDGLGAQSGKFYATQSRDSRMEPLTGRAQVYERSNAAITLPSLTVATSVSFGIRINAEIKLPQMSTAAYGGANGEPRLPKLVVAITATFPILGNSALILPRLTAAATGVVGAGADAAISLPMLSALGTFAGIATLRLPLLTTLGAVSTAEASTLAGQLPLLAVSGNISVFSYPGRGAILLPALRSGPAGTSALILPRLIVTSAPLASGTYEAWVINCRNKGVTRWTNFPFDQITSVGTQTYMLGAAGIYLLGGDNDILDPSVVPPPPIPWSIETGLTDFGVSGVKHLPYLYLDGIIDGVVEITIIDDNSREYTYSYATKQRGAVHQPHRRKLGNGIRTRNAAFRIASATGAYLELDEIEPEVTVTQRSL